MTYENPRTDIKIIAVPANSVAAELGSDKVANIVALGALVEATGIVEEETCIETIKDKLGKRKPQFLPMNLEAFAKGKEIARKILG